MSEERINTDDFFEKLEQKYREIGKLIEQKEATGVALVEIKDRYDSLDHRMEHLANTVNTQKAYAGSDGEELPATMAEQFTMFDQALDELRKQVESA